jgi:hypothetical protein
LTQLVWWLSCYCQFRHLVSRLGEVRKPEHPIWYTAKYKQEKQTFHFNKWTTPD